MNGAARRLMIVTSRYPFGTQEAYLSTELAELQWYFDRIVVVPVRPPAGPARHSVPDGVEVLAWPLFSFELLRRAARAVARKPRAALHALGGLIRSRDPGRFKNLAVTIKALAVGEWALQNAIDHIHAYWISTPATVAMLAANVSGARWSSTAHRWDIYERNAFDVKSKSASFIRTISTRGTADLAARMPSLNGRIIEVRLGTVVPQAVAANHRRDDELRIVCPAALVAVKGHAVLFAALAQLRGWGIATRCTLCGTGPLRAELAARAARLGLDEVVEFAGFVPHGTLLEWYRAKRFAVLALASLDGGESAMEGLPSALIEAMAFGLPVVATDSGSVAELLDQRCGRLVKPNDSYDLARALFEVAVDPAAANARARRAYERVASRHDVCTQMRQLAGALMRKE